MKTHFSKVQRMRLSILVMGGMLWASTASAANLVSTIPSDYGNSEMGAVTGSRVTTDVDATPQAGVLKNLNRDPASFGFHQKGKSMVLLRQYTYSTTELENTALIDPNSAGAAASAASGKTTSVPNMHAAAASDEYIYMTGYDLGQIGVMRQSGNRLMENKRAVVNLKNDIKQYCGYDFTKTFQNLDEDSNGEKGKTYTGEPEKAQVHGEALLVDGRRLYVAASVNPLGGYEPYDDGFLMQYDIQDDGSLKFGSYTRISRNIDQGRLNKFNNHILISCIGGYQHYNGTGNTHDTALNIAKIDQNTGHIMDTEQHRAVLPDHVKGTGEDMRDLKILPNGTAYVMTYNLSPTGSRINAHVYQTTMSNLMSEHPDDWKEVAVAHEQEGWFGKINAEYYTKRLWLELGDTLQAYMDGDSAAKHVWQAKDFSENKGFSRFNKITMIEPDWVYGNTASVVMTLPAELGGTTAAAVRNENAVWKDNAVYTDTVTTRQSWDGDTVVSIGRDKLGDKSTNVLAAISAIGGKRLNINAKKNLLQLQVENTVGNPTGIYARGTDLTVSAATKGINILTRGVDGGNTLTNAVQLDALKDKAAKITINGPLSISMTGGFGGNGVAIQKSDHFGEKSYEADVASGIRINGNLKIAGERTDQWGIPLNRENVFSRFNNAGILTQVEKSNVIVNGDADMTVYGNGVTTNAKDSSVRIAGGGTIQVPADMKYSYYALAAYQGAISMNMGDDGTKPGNGKKINEIADVKLDGDLFALPTGRLDVALMTDKSYLHGLVDNGGTANLYLQNGAKWLNEGRNERYYQDDEDMGAGTMTAVKTRAGGTVGKFYHAQSHITNFIGGATEAQRGIIYQKSINPLTIENYSGHTAAIFTHDAAAPTSFRGGDIVINKATGTENVFTLFTDGAGVTTGNQNAVLNALAGKLTYKSFGENKLLGKLSIGESLTASSINGDIAFGNEKGSYAGTAAPLTPPSTEQTKTEFTSQLTQKSIAEYKDANVEPSPGDYKFTKDTTIRRSSYDGIIAATTYPKQPLNVDASGHRLTLIGDGNNFILGMNNDSKDGIKVTADALKIDVKSGSGRAFGIRNNQDGSVVTIKGALDIKAKSRQSAQGLVTSRGAAIKTDGLHVEVNKDAADGSWAISNIDGVVAVNKDGAHDVVINGNVQTGEEGNTDISLTTEQSTLNGIIQKTKSSGSGEDEDEEEEFSLPVVRQQNSVAKGNVLTLQNGAAWTNEDYNAQKNILAKSTFTGSQLLSLKGGEDVAHGGVIFQKNDKDITVDNYSGNMRVFYAHDAAVPTTVIGGALRIGKAAADSSITLTTDYSGLNTNAVSGADKKLVDDALNALANKLWYAAYTKGERNLSGKAEIAEGLTTSAVSKRIENITFDGVTGQGRYMMTPPPAPPRTEQTKTAFATQLTQKEITEYKDANVESSPGNYKFTKDTTISKTSYAGTISNTGFPKNLLTIDAGGHVLTVKGEGNNGLVTGIKNSGENGITIAADTVKLNVKSVTGKAYGVWNAKNGSTIKLTGNLDISATGGDAAKGLFASKDAVIETDGLDIALNKASLDGWTIDNNGTIKVNKEGKHKVTLYGNVHSGVNGSIDLSLTTAESTLSGVVHKEGETANGVSLLLTNGATWNNQDWNQSSAVLEKESFIGSHLATLRGGSNANKTGVIFQKNDKDISIDNYSGHTRVFYVHDSSAPTTMKGGDLHIKNAATGSSVTLTTDSTGLNTESTAAVDKNLVSATLNALANKLRYTAYTTGERNLTGKAEIAEGLTTSAASKRIEDITFDGMTGQGSYVYTPQSEVTSAPITESETLAYDRQALATQPNTKGGRIVSALYTDNTAYDKQHPMVVDMNGHCLYLEANSENQIASAIYGGNNKNIKIVNSGAEKMLTVKASNTDTRAANGIQTEANAHIYIQGPVTIEDVHAKGYNATAIQTSGTIGSPSDVTVDGDLTVQSVRADRVDTKNKGADDGRNLAALQTTGDETKITVKGNVDIQNIKGSVLKTVGADSVIDVGGGTMSAAEDANRTKQYHAVHAEKGTVNINAPKGVSGDRKTNITGDMYVTREYGKKTIEYSGGQLVDFDSKGVLNVSLSTADSSWMGAATYDVNRKDFGSGGFTAHDVGQFNLTLQNGAHWVNERKSSVTDKWLGSRLASLRGGGDAGHAGVIFQRNDKDIKIDNYSGYTRVFYAHDASAPTTMKGGDFHIKNAAAGSAVILTTDSAGLHTESTAAADKNLVSATLNALANKLWYTAYTTGERNLTGKAEIAEGLTTSAASKRIENIAFDTASGQGGYAYTPAVDLPASQTDTAFTAAITGDEADATYMNAGVRKPDGTYAFTKDSTITTGKNLISAGAWMNNISAAVSSANRGKTLDVDLNGKNLAVKTVTDVSTTGITAIGKNSKVNVKNAGAISIDAESTAGGQTAALFVNGGGAIHIQNGGSNLEDKVLKVRSNGTAKTNVALIKSMNGVPGVESNIMIDGLVDVLADGNDAANGKGANEAVSAVASKIDIGGGSIRAINGAWAAIRAYGEFVTQNYGTINFNVTKGTDGLANGADTKHAVIEGDIVTNGGMGTKGRVSVGLSTADSHWIGNYADTRGYGVTQGQLGAVNLFMKNGSYWKGFANGSMKVEMSGEGTNWTGFNVGDNMQLRLSDGAIWHNAITPEQKDQGSNPAISKVKYFTGEGGFIDMTGTNRFLASSQSLSGAPVKTGSSSIEEKGLGETGDLMIDEFNGSTTMLYRHNAATPTTIYGGKVTIGKAAADSLVKMVTDNVGLNTESTAAADKNLVSATLNALANKLWYTAYTTGERNLTGKAEIAEGLTTSAASKRIENITFDTASGQGSYVYTPATEPNPNPNPNPNPSPNPNTNTNTNLNPSPNPNQNQNLQIEYGDYETKLMSGVKSAMTASIMSWRAEANDLMKRMGDLRLSPQDAGVWARVYRGKSTSNKDKVNFRMNYSTIQVGYDKKIGDDWRVGVAGSYMEGSSTYADGSGKNKEGNLGVYGTWTGKSGQYVDLIAKIGRLQNEYAVYNDFGHYVKGDYSIWGGSLSAEYGKRIAMKGGNFIEPQVELIYSHMQGKSYVGSTDYIGMNMYVHQKPYDSFIGRLGFGFGKETARSTFYARASLYHEFAGDIHTEYSDGFIPKSTVQGGSDTWVGVQLGGTMKLNDRTNLYGNFEKTFGGDVKTAWRMDAGMRWNF